MLRGEKQAYLGARSERVSEGTDQGPDSVTKYQAKGIEWEEGGDGAGSVFLHLVIFPLDIPLILQTCCY